MSYINVFRTMFPEGAGYEHDKIDRRTELTEAQKPEEPRNADSHLAFMAGALRTCVTYRNRPDEPVCFIDLDGVHEGRPRKPPHQRAWLHERGDGRSGPHRRAGVAPRCRFGQSEESAAGYLRAVRQLVAQHGVKKGRIRLSLAPGERHAGLTVNEYETLLMRHDLSEVLRDPMRFMAEKAGHMLGNPLAIPAKTLDYAKYDLVRVFNQLIDSLGLHESMVESVLARAIAMPASRFLRMKRSVSLFVSDRAERSRARSSKGPIRVPSWSSGTAATASRACWTSP